MEILLYNNKSDKNVLNKSITKINNKGFNCFPFEDFSILNPVVILNFEGDEIQSFANVNYAQINECGRFYFVDNITILDKNRIKISMSVDVLMSFRNEILKTSQHIIRNADKNQQNAYLKDNLMQLNSETKHAVYRASANPLDNTPSGHCFVFNSL